MKVAFFNKSSPGEGVYAHATSDLVSNDLDLIELLLASDLSDLDKVREFENVVFVQNSTWWFNATKVELDGKVAMISAAFDIDAGAKIELEVLKKVLAHWKVFLHEKEPREYHL